MKRIFAFVLALLTVASLFSCTPAEEDETIGETGEETQADTAAETEAETEGESGVENVYFDRFPKGAEPKTIYFADANGSREEQVLLSSLQGLACRLTEEHIYNGDLNCQWLPAMKQLKPDVTYTDIVDEERATVWPLVNHYYEAGLFDSYILCTEANPVSVDIAITLAGLLDALVVIDTLQATMDEIGYKCVMDVREYDDAWLRSSEYWDQLRRDMSFQAGYTVATCLIDWAVFSGGSYYTNYTGQVPAEQMAKYDFLDDNAIIFGYNHSLGEYTFIESHSLINANLIPTDFMSNLSVFRSFAQETMTQSRVEMTDEILEPGNVHTVTFVYSDGDNMCFTAGALINYVNHPRKEDVPISYGVPATSIDLIAPILKTLYDTKSDGQEYVMSLSGIGYTNPGRWTDEARGIMTEQLGEYMKRSDLKYMIMLDGFAWDERILADFTEHEGIEGIFHIQGFVDYPGQIIWTNGKPSVYARSDFYGGYDEYYPVILDWLNRESLSVDPQKSRSYSMYYVGAWCTGRDVVASLVDQLGENVDVVTPDVFMQRLIHNCKPAEE